MYQTAGSEAVRMQVEECIGVPFFVREITGGSENKSLVYDNTDTNADATNNDDAVVSDEVEDLYLLLQQIQQHHPEVTAVSSGAILSTYQRTRIEHVCSRLNLTSLSYLWRMSNQRTVLNSILDDGQIDAVLVRVACPPGLMPYRHLGKSLRTLRDMGTLDKLKERWGMHPAGEGGEYETLVLDCPSLFKLGKLVLEETEIVCDGSNDGVGILRITKCSVEKRYGDVVEDNATIMSDGDQEKSCTSCASLATEQVQKAKSTLVAMPPDTNNHIHQSMHLPNIKMMKGGLCHISALVSPIAAACNSNNLDDDEAQLAVAEFLSIRDMLQSLLSRLYPNDKPSTSPQDILYVHLYLSEISHFAKINAHYKAFFGMQMPPSRSCVAVGKGALPGGRRVMMDCILQRGSGGYLRSVGNNNSSETKQEETFLQKALVNNHHALRKTLHVQSISYWAPVCIGPYSQANVVRNALVFMAGMIGLVPQSMKLIQPPTSSNDVSSWEVQLYQSWKNAACVLDGLEDGGGKLEDCLGGLIYFSADALEAVCAADESQYKSGNSFPWQRLWQTAQCISNDAISTNAGVVLGSVDGLAADTATSDNLDPTLYDEDGELYGGYEDEETWREMSSYTAAATPSESTNTSDGSLQVPMLMVCLPELPANAEAEVELILASRRAAACLGIGNSSVVQHTISSSVGDCISIEKRGQNILWDTGYDDQATPATVDTHAESTCIGISSVSRFIGLGCACVSTVMAFWKPADNVSGDDAATFNFDMENVLSKMIDSSINNAKSKDDLSSLFTFGDILNVRLYYKAASVSSRRKSIDGSSSSSVDIEMVDDGSMLRTQLHSVLQSKSCRAGADTPAYTVVPVLGMHLSADVDKPSQEVGVPLIAMQVTLVDSCRMETEMWVRHNRTYQYDN